MSKVDPAVFIAVAFLGTAPLLAEGPRPQASPGARAALPLTRADARRNALEASPGLQALGAQVRAAEGASRQARALSNPELRFEAEDLGGDPALVAAQRTLSIEQGVEWLGKRSARIAAAERSRDVAALDLARGRRDLLAEVDRKFAALLGAQERDAIAAQNVETAREVTRAVASLVDAGEASPVEAARAESEEALAVIDRASARRDLELARRELARLWGEDSPSFPEAAGALDAAVELPDRDASLAALARLPDLARWGAEAERQASLVTAARRQVLPDLTLSVGTRSTSGLDGRTWVAGLAFPLPVFTQFAGARAEATARQQQAAFERRAEEVRVRSEFLGAYATLERARDEARALRDEVLPRAEKVYAALGEGYRRGKFRLLDLLEARRTLAQTRLRTLDALVRLATADADLKRLVPDPASDTLGADR